VGKVHAAIDEPIRAFVARQPMFFVGTAPLASDGHVNLSPKGLAGTFAVLDPHTVAYLDLTGSGVETIAHLRENGRITLMFCAFDGPARIVRLYGDGDVVLPDDPDFAGLMVHFPTIAGARAVIRVALDRISDSCGYGVPKMEYVADRDRLSTWSATKGPDGLTEYRREKNATSIDGLPGLDP
jgi:predicted pyridoxine 5'-phosphate oxidase superfamily flavin-nucleotide-binding protein